MKLEHLSKYFFGGQAESEMEIIGEIVVLPENINEFTNFDFINYKLLCAPKGAGKSTVINYISQFHLMNLTYSLIVDPRSLDCEPINKKSVQSDKTNEASRQLLKLIASKIGESISFAKTKGDSALVKIYEESQGDENALSFLINITKQFTPDNVKHAIDYVKQTQHPNQKFIPLVKDVTANLQKSDKKFILFIDNIDWAIEEKEPKFDYGTAWSIIEAAIDLANRIPDLAVVISVRTDVWHTMTKVRGHGSTISDKIQEIITLRNTEDDIQKMFNTRLEKAATRHGVDTRTTNYIQHFFDQEWITIPGRSESARTWDQWVSKNSRFRPRDMVHLMQFLCKEAIRRTKSKDSKISFTDLNSIRPAFTETRLENISKEYRQIFPEIRQAMDAFSKDFFNFSELLTFLKTLPSTPKEIDGIKLKPDNNEDAIKILRILVMANFINPRIEGKDGKPYKHIQFEDDMNLIDYKNFNNLNNYNYQIHPTFLEYVRRPH